MTPEDKLHEDVARRLCAALRTTPDEGCPRACLLCGTLAQDVLAALGIPLATLAKLRSGELVAVPAANRWQPAGTEPRDGTPIIARMPVTVRWLPYKPGSVQYQNGLRGRWQEANEFGGWANTRVKPMEWRPVREFGK